MQLRRKDSPRSEDHVEPAVPEVSRRPAHRRDPMAGSMFAGFVAAALLPVLASRHGGCGLLHRDGAVRMGLRVGALGGAVDSVHRPAAALGRGARDLHGGVWCAGALRPGRRCGRASLGLAAGSVGLGGLGLGPRQADDSQSLKGVAAVPGVGRSGGTRPGRGVRADPPRHRTLSCDARSTRRRGTVSTHLECTGSVGPR